MVSVSVSSVLNAVLDVLAFGKFVVAALITTNVSSMVLLVAKLIELTEGFAARVVTQGESVRASTSLVFSDVEVGAAGAVREASINLGPDRVALTELVNSLSAVAVGVGEELVARAAEVVVLNVSALAVSGLKTVGALAVLVVVLTSFPVGDLGGDHLAGALRGITRLDALELVVDVGVSGVGITVWEGHGGVGVSVLLVVNRVDNAETVAAVAHGVTIRIGQETVLGNGRGGRRRLVVVRLVGLMVSIFLTVLLTVSVSVSVRLRVSIRGHVLPSLVVLSGLLDGLEETDTPELGVLSGSPSSELLLGSVTEAVSRSTEFAVVGSVVLTLSLSRVVGGGVLSVLRVSVVGGSPSPVLALLDDVFVGHPQVPLVELSGEVDELSKGELLSGQFVFVLPVRTDGELQSADEVGHVDILVHLLVLLGQTLEQGAVTGIGLEVVALLDAVLGALVGLSGSKIEVRKRLGIS